MEKDDATPAPAETGTVPFKPVSMTSSTRVPSSSGPAAGAQLSLEEQGFLRSRNTAASFGEVLGALMRSPRHRKLRLEELENFAVPAMTHGQFAVANAQVPNRPGETAPVGAIFWALVTPEIDQRLSRAASFPLEIGRNEWRCGDILWIVDAAGPQQVVERLVAEVSARSLGGRMPKLPPHLG